MEAVTFRESFLLRLMPQLYNYALNTPNSLNQGNALIELDLAQLRASVSRNELTTPNRSDQSHRRHKDLWGPIWVGTTSVISDRLPQLDAISFWVGEPAKLAEIITFAFGIDRDAFVYQTVQHYIEVIDLKIDHRFLCRWKVRILLPEEGQDNLIALLRGGKREKPLGPHQTEMALVP